MFEIQERHAVSSSRIRAVWFTTEIASPIQGISVDHGVECEVFSDGHRMIVSSVDSVVEITRRDMGRFSSSLAGHKSHADSNDVIDSSREPVDAHEYPHLGWAEAAKLMHARGEDQLLDPFFPTKFDEEEEEWE